MTRSSFSAQQLTIVLDHKDGCIGSVLESPAARHLAAGGRLRGGPSPGAASECYD